MHKPELLAPAGNPEKLRMALRYGADAVYLGGKDFSLRAFSGNFSLAEIQEAVIFAHNLNKKVYVTINIFPHNEDLIQLPEYIAALRDIGVDAFIIADLGVFRVARTVAPEIPLHISTQANNTNWASVLGWQEMGAKRVVLARELSLTEIQLIRSKASLELEAFVHGAMCISYSGRCLLSNYLTGRDANRGECAQPCRWKYSLVEETRPNEYLPVLEDERGTYIFNSKDLCLLEHIPELVETGLNSFKIEGRMKSVYYVAVVVKAYRDAIDRYLADPVNYTMQPKWLEEVSKISHREYTTGFYFQKAGPDDQIYGSSSYIQPYDFVGLVKGYNKQTKMALVEQRNRFQVGDEVEIVQPGKDFFQQRITAIINETGEAVAAAPHPQQLVQIPVEEEVVEFAMLRRRGAANA
ncbi:MAG: peptidase [Firmicutes bacterium]|nr:peptidase [Bacillota bacterium]